MHAIRLALPYFLLVSSAYIIEKTERANSLKFLPSVSSLPFQADHFPVRQILVPTTESFFQRGTLCSAINKEKGKKKKKKKDLLPRGSRTATGIECTPSRSDYRARFRSDKGEMPQKEPFCRSVGRSPCVRLGRNGAHVRIRKFPSKGSLMAGNSRRVSLSAAITN